MVAKRRQHPPQDEDADRDHQGGGDEANEVKRTKSESTPRAMRSQPATVSKVFIWVFLSGI